MAPSARKPLRSGFTTGTAAAAATKAALMVLRDRSWPDSVRIELLNNQCLDIPVHKCHMVESTAICTVIKDAGDDPDVTHRAEIGAKVRVETVAKLPAEGHWIVIEGGPGVGTVTKPGLDVPPGQPAINPGPQKMIRRAVRGVIGPRPGRLRVRIEIFVPKGEILARKTLNARLGIIGGISILGTTGVVKPMSHAAYTATIRAAMSVARATGLDRVVLTTGRRSERYAQNLLQDIPAEAFIQIGDYFQFSLQTAAEFEFRIVCLAVFFGKALKMAQGFAHTHAARSRINFKALAEWIHRSGGNRAFCRQIQSVNTARQAFELIRATFPEFVDRVGLKIAGSARRFVESDLAVDVIIFDYQGHPAYDSSSNRDSMQ